MDYYRSHWLDIEPERLEKYDASFQWNPLMEGLIQGFGLEEAECLVDYGCGPGWTALEMAGRMGSGAQVIGCDINKEMIGLANRHGNERGLADRVQWRHVTDDKIPLPDRAADRVFCKNTLVYVPSMDETLAEFRRVLKPGGMVRMMDSDWGLFAVEPCDPEMFIRLMSDAKHAFRDPQAGRKMYGAAKQAGFTDVQVVMISLADTDGLLMDVPLKNMVTYAKAAGFPSEEGDRFAADCQQALARRELLIISSMFIVTGTAL